MSSPDHFGDIVMIYGSMFAGKTGRLISYLNRSASMGQNVLLISHSNDTREDATKSGILTVHCSNPGYVDNNVDEIMVASLSEIPNNKISEYNVIGIDEAQFFDDILKVVEWTQMGIAIYTSGLLATSEGTFFGNYYKLLPYAKHEQLFANCTKCFEETKNCLGTGICVDAIATRCLVTKNTAIMVGSDNYQPTCLKHWKNNK